MRPKSAKYLQDMLEGAKAIQQATANLTVDGFLSQTSLRHSVQWNFVVIGEALSQLVKFDPQTAAQISEYTRIIAFRNQLVHGYGVIDSKITWSIITEKLPVLIKEIQHLLQNAWI